MSSIALSKKEVANMMEVDPKTLGNYCNKRYYEELQLLGYHKNQKKFTPAQVKYLKEKLGF